MTIELSLLISGISVAAAVYFAIKGSNRAEKADIKSETASLTTVIVKLETIGTGITEIKTELAKVKNDMQEDHDRLVKVEESLGTLWRRHDELHGITRGEER